MTVSDGTDPAPTEAAEQQTAEEQQADEPASEAVPPDAALQLQLPLFEGPLDLLLHLIEREELDVTELSVLEVTEQYMTQLRAAEEINLGALADFVAMGARLLLLKSRALLPREITDIDDEEDGDALDLVSALREYRRYRVAAEHLRGLEDEHRTAYRREAAPPDVTLPSGLDDVTLDGLVGIFREILKRLPEEEEVEKVERAPIRLADRVSALISRLEQDDRVSFRALVGGATTRMEVIIDFMAVLELIKSRFLEAQQDNGGGDIELVRLAGAQAPTEADLEETIDEV